MSERRLALSYSRFSDPKQAHGDSEDRQGRMFRDFCSRHNLTPLAEAFSDRGKSGYHDAHRKSGRLGQLITMARDGRFEPGTVLVVEAWDRLGRLRPDKMTALVSELVRLGMAIGVCRLDDVFVEEDFGTHKWTTLAVFIQLAYQESKQKADRVAASWEKRREDAREKGRLLTTRLPAWLERVGGDVQVIPERAAAIKRIFRLAAQGYGHTRIVKAMTDEGFPPFGQVAVRKGRTRSQFSGRWQRPYVALLLNDRRVLGEFVPHKAGGEKVRGVAAGAPIENYFPAVISAAEFDLARSGQERRDTAGETRGKVCRGAGKYVNVFRGLLRHATDGGGMLLQNKGTAASPNIVLINTSGIGGHAPCRTFPYFTFESAVLKMLLEVDPKDVMPQEDATPSRLTVLRARLAAVRGDVGALQEDLKAGYSKRIAEVLRDKEAEEERVAVELQEELARSVRPAERAWKDLPGLADLVATGGDEARLRLRPVLRRVIESGWVLIVPRGMTRLCCVQFFFSGGGRRDYLIVHRPARAGFGERKKASWSARSFTSPAGDGALDLRDPDHAQRLEKVLSTLPLEKS
jgi:DNA invertase Pin-like site-specific DNA recombinase